MQINAATTTRTFQKELSSQIPAPAHALIHPPVHTHRITVHILNFKNTDVSVIKVFQNIHGQVVWSLVDLTKTD